MFDSYGDGWNGNSLTIGGEQYCCPDAFGDCASTDVWDIYADSVTYDLCIDLDACLEIIYNAMLGETSWSIADATGAILASGGAGESGFVGDCGFGCTEPFLLKRNALFWVLDAPTPMPAITMQRQPKTMALVWPTTIVAFVVATTPRVLVALMPLLATTATASIDDGSCLANDGCGVCGVGCSGCTDATACNFDPNAIFDDGSCVLPDPVDGCSRPAISQ